MTLLLFKILTKKLWWILLLAALLNLFFFERLSTNAFGFYPQKGHTKMTYFLFAAQAFGFALWMYLPKSQLNLFKQLFGHTSSHNRASQFRCVGTVYLMLALLTQWLPLMMFITLIAPSGTYLTLDIIGFFAIWLISSIGFAVGVLCAVTRQKHAAVLAFFVFTGLVMLDIPWQPGIILWGGFLGLLIALGLATSLWRNVGLTLLYTLIISEVIAIGWQIVTPQFRYESAFSQQQTSGVVEDTSRRPNEKGEFISRMHSLHTHPAFNYQQWGIRPDWINHTLYSSRLDRVAYPQVRDQNRSNFEQIWQSEFQHQSPLHFEFAGGQQAFMFEQAIIVESPDGKTRKIWAAEQEDDKITHSLIHSDSVRTTYSSLLLRHAKGYTWISQDSEGEFSSNYIPLNKRVWLVKVENMAQSRALQLVTRDGVRYQYRWSVDMDNAEETARENVNHDFLARKKVRLLTNPALTALVMSNSVFGNEKLASFVSAGIVLNVLCALCMLLLQRRAKPGVRILAAVVSLVFGIAAFLAAILVFKPELRQRQGEFAQLNDISLVTETAHNR